MWFAGTLHNTVSGAVTSAVQLRTECDDTTPELSMVPKQQWRMAGTKFRLDGDNCLAAENFHNALATSSKTQRGTQQSTADVNWFRVQEEEEEEEKTLLLMAVKNYCSHRANAFLLH